MALLECMVLTKENLLVAFGFQDLDVEMIVLLEVYGL